MDPLPARRRSHFKPRLMEETPTGLSSSRMSYTESCIERTGWEAAAPISSRDFEFLQHAAAAHGVKRTGIALFASANICRWNARLTSKTPICGLSLVTLRYGHRLACFRKGCSHGLPGSGRNCVSSRRTGPTPALRHTEKFRTEMRADVTRRPGDGLMLIRTETA